VKDTAPAATEHTLKRIFGYAVTGGVPRRALGTALVVGTTLNLINQGDLLISGHSINFLKLALTYCVPYIVTTYGAVSFRAYADRAARRQFGSPRGQPEEPGS
jgi:hypothetical protein